MYLLKSQWPYVLWVCFLTLFLMHWSVCPNSNITLLITVILKQFMKSSSVFFQPHSPIPLLQGYLGCSGSVDFPYISANFYKKASREFYFIGIWLREINLWETDLDSMQPFNSWIYLLQRSVVSATFCRVEVLHISC